MRRITFCLNCMDTIFSPIFSLIFKLTNQLSELANNILIINATYLQSGIQGSVQNPYRVTRRVIQGAVLCAFYLRVVESLILTIGLLLLRTVSVPKEQQVDTKSYWRPRVKRVGDVLWTDDTLLLDSKDICYVSEIPE